MGQTADQLREQVDQAREDATQKIEDIGQQVTQAAQQVKDKFDWRHQVDDRPLVAVGAALIGGMVLGGVLGGGNDSGSSQQSGQQSGESRYYETSHRSGGMGNAIRNAAKTSGFEDTIQHLADTALGSLGERVREVAEQNFPSLAGKSKSVPADKGQQASTADRSRDTAPRIHSAAPMGSQTGGGMTGD